MNKTQVADTFKCDQTQGSHSPSCWPPHWPAHLKHVNDSLTPSSLPATLHSSTAHRLNTFALCLWQQRGKRRRTLKNIAQEKVWGDAGQGKENTGNGKTKKRENAKGQRSASQPSDKHEPSTHAHERRLTLTHTITHARSHQQ